MATSKPPLEFDTESTLSKHISSGKLAQQFENASIFMSALAARRMRNTFENLLPSALEAEARRRRFEVALQGGSLALYALTFGHSTREAGLLRVTIMRFSGPTAPYIPDRLAEGDSDQIDFMQEAVRQASETLPSTANIVDQLAGHDPYNSADAHEHMAIGLYTQAGFATTALELERINQSCEPLF